MDNPELPASWFRQTNQVAIFRTALGYEWELWNEFTFVGDRSLVARISAGIPKSYIESVGVNSVFSFCNKAFVIMQKLRCENPLSVLYKLRKKYRKLKLKIVKTVSALKEAFGVNLNYQQTLGWFLQRFYEFLKALWEVSKKEQHFHKLRNKVTGRQDQILLADHLI